MKDPKISYAIPVHNEYEEIDGLIKHLLKYKKEADEIIVQCDKGNTTENVYKVLDKYHNKIKVIEFPLNRDFASFKNNLKNHQNFISLTLLNLFKLKNVFGFLIQD